MSLDLDFLRKILRYEPETGLFFWRTRTPEMFKDAKHSAKHRCACWNSRYAGVRAGSVSKISGYMELSIGKKLYLGHRLAVFYMTGEWAKFDVDHLNLDRSDNSWKNIRPATRSQNKANAAAHKDNLLGVKGVRVCGSKFSARICKKGISYYLGVFDTVEEAAKAYSIAAKNLYEDFARKSEAA